MADLTQLIIKLNARLEKIETTLGEVKALNQAQSLELADLHALLTPSAPPAEFAGKDKGKGKS